MISRDQLPSSTGFHLSVDLHLTLSDAQLGFPSCGNPALPFEELIELHQSSPFGCH